MPYKNKADRRAFDARRRAETRKVIEDWFSTRPCVDCGNSDRRVLEPDHVRGKNFKIAMGGFKPIKVLKAELALCESRCANCHKIRHWEKRKNSEVTEMAKANTTAASQAHKPESVKVADQPHAHKYPGRAVPAAEKVVDPSHDHGALKAGRGNSMGVSANGSHKGLPSSKEEVGKHGEQPATPKFAHHYPGV